MRIFLYEYVTGGGMRSEDPPAAPSGSLLAEGAAMLSALAEDFARLAEAHVEVLRDARMPPLRLAGVRSRPVDSAAGERIAFEELARACDATVLIAPECRGALLTRCRWAEEAGARLLSPSAAFVAIAGDKAATLRRLREAGVPTPRSAVWDELPARAPPGGSRFVAKPRDGAGSQGVRLVASRQDFPSGALGDATLLESHVPGLAASVACLCGPAGATPLPACEQLLSDDGRFYYLGGRLPLPRPLRVRAQTLAERALAALPPAVGYVGVDLVLGAPEDGGGDAVIEVNPRLTTSYVGLRRAARGNLAEVMRAAAEGRPVALSFDAQQLEFTADGRVFPAAPRSPSPPAAVP